MSPRFKAISAALVIFTGGLVVGGAGALWLSTRFFFSQLSADPNAPAPADYLLHYVESDLVGQLGLNSAEQTALHAELVQGAAAVKRARAEGIRQMALTFAAHTDRIARGLPPEKAAAFRRLASQRFKQFGLDDFAPPAPADQPRP